MKRGAPVGCAVMRVWRDWDLPEAAGMGTPANWHAPCKSTLNPPRSTTIDTMGP